MPVDNRERSKERSFARELKRSFSIKPLPRNKSLIVWQKQYINSNKRLRTKTICDNIRTLHRMAQERNDLASMQLLDICNDMAKRMQDKLKIYSMLYGGKVTLTVDDIGGMYWMMKNEFKNQERMAAKRAKGDKPK